MSAPGRHARPGARAPRLRLPAWRLPRWRLPRWYLLPLPLAVLLAMAMPWIAVRDIRDSSSAFKTLCDVLVKQGERLRQAEQPDVPEPRRLYLVK